MPVLGLGVWQMAAGGETEQAVEWALEAGYRHIDTASVYRNEQSVGAALRRSGLPREQVFVTTKLMPAHPSAARELDKSLERLSLDYVDLYLIHWPLPLLSARLWRELESLQERGLAREIGVSNFGRHRLETLMRGASRMPCRRPGPVQPLPLPAPAARLLPGAGHRLRGLQSARAWSGPPGPHDHRGRRAPRPDARPGHAPLGDPAPGQCPFSKLGLALLVI